jgi:murein DD-endopeptidase MepM/ murein hydrolase activator NlpD
MILCPLPNKAYRITQRYYDRPNYYKKYGLKSHAGIDYAPPSVNQKGVVVHAPHDGYVHSLDFGDKGFGKHIYITSLPYAGDKCRQSVLAHFQAVLVSEGQFVAQGDPVGIMGTTGDSTAVHCHHGYRTIDKGKIVEEDNGNNGFTDIERFILDWYL